MNDNDYMIISYLERVGYAETDILCEKFFNSTRKAQSRLKILTEKKVIKRTRLYKNNIPSNYIYALPDKKFTNQIEHLSYVARLAPYLERTHEYIVESIVYESELLKGTSTNTGIRCDGVIKLRRADGKHTYFVVECERCHTNLQIKIDKYTKYFKEGLYKDKFPVEPTLILITNNTLKQQPPFRVKVLPLNFY